MHSLVERVRSESEVPDRAWTINQPLMAVAPDRVRAWLAVVVVCLTVLSLAGTAWGAFPVQNPLVGEARESFQRLFRLDGEANISAWYQSTALLLAAALLALIALSERRRSGRLALYWSGLALIFLYLSVDEEAIIHEMAIKPIRSAFHPTGLLYYGWIVPAGTCVLLFLLAYLRFLGQLPAATRLRFLVAGFIYVSGALGLEALSGLFVERHGEQGLGYVLSFHAEEVCEMTGIVIFLHALLSYMQSHLAHVSIRFGVGEHRRAVPPITPA
jgi:hypothetical protein